MADAEKREYESPVIFDYGEFGELTQHQPSGDPLQHPLPDPHMMGSITDGHH
jgi:hypothetical protein